MPYRPSRDKSLQAEIHNELWEVLEPIYDNSCALDPVPRFDWTRLVSEYIIERKFGYLRRADAMRGRLPRGFDPIPLGPTEIELLCFMMSYAQDRVLVLQGPRGAGKTSLLHYVETAARQSGYGAYPILIMINCLEADRDLSAEDMTRRMVVQLLELERRVAVPVLCQELKEAAARLRDGASYGALAEMFVHLRSRLPDEIFSRLVLVFDNLDHLSGPSIGSVLDFAREVYVVSHIACVVALRPACLDRAVSRGDARAFFTSRLNVNAPSTEAWVRSLGRRMERAARSYTEKIGAPLKAFGEIIEPIALHEAMSKFASLLRGHRPGDNVMMILDAVAADDTRHLLLLVRRILGHRELPGCWMLKGGEWPTFHPLTALFEGPTRLFVGNACVPNLLVFESDDSGPDFLLNHRILCLLNSSMQPMSTNTLLHLVAFLGHGRAASIHCLMRLHESLLVRSTDAEFVDPKGALPGAFFLTEAGLYYFHHLMSSTDYLSTAILDVPIAHAGVMESMRVGEMIAFEDRLQSLIEYAEEVRRLEAIQLSRLQRDPRKGVRVAQALRKGGLLCAALCHGLDTAAQRGFFSTSAGVHRASWDLVPRIRALRGWIAAAERRLTGIVMKAHLSVRAGLPTVPLTIGGDELVLRGDRQGGGVDCTGTLRSHSAYSATVVGVVGPMQRRRFARLAVAVPAKDRGGALSITLPNVPISAFDPRLTAQVVRDIPFWGTATFLDKRVGLISSDHFGDMVQLRLHIVGEDPGESKSYAIGPEVRRETLKKETESVFDQVMASVLAEGSQGDASSYSLTECIEAMGTRLGKLVLSPEGLNILAAHHRLLDHVALFSGESEFVVPWEWLRPAAGHEFQEMRMIGQVWHVLRWPAVRMADIIQGTGRLVLHNPHSTIGSFCTVGLGTDSRFPWRTGTPDTLGELKEIARRHTTLHIVGHMPSPGVLRVTKNLDITVDWVWAHGLQGPSNLILSACKAGAAPVDNSIPIALMTTSGSSVWAPLVPIQEGQAERLDGFLGGKRSPQESMARLMRLFSLSDPLGSIYVRYGIHQDPHTRL